MTEKSLDGSECEPSMFESPPYRTHEQGKNHQGISMPQLIADVPKLVDQWIMEGAEKENEFEV